MVSVLTSLQRDENGYLLDENTWAIAIAEALAIEEHIELTEAHWEVIHFVREFYQQYDTSPAIRLLVKAIKAAYGEEKGNSLYLFKLFPKGPAKQATKIAGLPKPAKCL